MKQLRAWLPLIAIVIISFLVRFLYLESVPIAINNDQLHYILNARSFVLTGTDLSGTINIFEVLLFRYPLNELPQAELPFFLVLPFVAFFPFSLPVVAFPNVFISSATVVILYLVANKLFNKNVGLLTALVATFNPWFVFMGRTLYEVVPATFFYLCFIYVLLIAKGWKILWTFPLMLLAFYSYIGTKLIFLPVVFFTLVYVHFVVHKKKYLRQYSLLFILASLFVGFFLIQIHQGSDTSRLSEIVTPNHPAVSERVDEVRKASLQHPLLSVFENKMTMYGRLLLENFLHVFSLEYLFLKGDGFFSLERHGLFYVIDLLFIITGAGWLFIKKRLLFIYFLLVILVSTLPQIIHDPKASGNFTPHIALIFPFFLILIALGVYQSFYIFPKRWRLAAGISLIGMYLFLIANFFHIYFAQLPLRTGLFDYPTRLLSRYAVLAEDSGKDLLIYSPETGIAFKKYLFYTNSLTKEAIEEINQGRKKGIYQLNNVTFLPCNDTKTSTSSAVIIHDKICGKSTQSGAVGLPQLKDSGSMYLLYGDKLCASYSLRRYVEGLSLKDIAMENMSPQIFCETFMLQVE